MIYEMKLPTRTTSKTNKMINDVVIFVFNSLFIHSRKDHPNILILICLKKNKKIFD